MPSTTFTLTRGDDDIDLDIDYEVSSYDPGCSCGPPEFCEPPSGGEVESLTAYHDGKKLVLTDAEAERIELHIVETHDYEN